MSLLRHSLFGCAAVILTACLVIQVQAAASYLKGDVVKQGHAARPDNAGVEQIAAMSAGHRQGLAGNWRVIRISGKNIVGRKPLDIRITANGQISGHSGCNGFGGSFKAEQDRISFSRMAATLMACQRDLMRQEQALYDAFGKAVRFQGGQNRLVLLDKRGSQVLVFVRR